MKLQNKVVCNLAKKSAAWQGCIKLGLFSAQPLSIQLPPVEGRGKGHIKHRWSSLREESTSTQVSNLSRVILGQDGARETFTDELSLLSRCLHIAFTERVNHSNVDVG